MKQLNKDQDKQRNDLLARLELADKAMQDAIAKANEIIENEVARAIDSYNEVVTDMETFRDEIVGEMSSYYDDRSEKWQDSDTGQAYSGWKDDWEGLDVSPVEAVEVIEDREVDHHDNLANMASELPE